MSKKTNSEIRRIARESLEDHWGNAVITTLIYFIISFVLVALFSYVPWGQIEIAEGAQISVLSYVLELLLIPLEWGFSLYFLRIIRNEQPTVCRLFDGYKDFVRMFLTGLLMSVYIFLWSLLLIVPGIIKALSYAMTPYILRDHPELRYDAAIRESMRMMQGNKMKLFLLILSFIGWFILALIPFGLGLFLFLPYYRTSIAAFYEDLKGGDAGTVTPGVIEEETVENDVFTIAD